MCLAPRTATRDSMTPVPGEHSQSAFVLFVVRYPSLAVDCRLGVDARHAVEKQELQQLLLSKALSPSPSPQPQVAPQQPPVPASSTSVTPLPAARPLPTVAPVEATPSRSEMSGLRTVDDMKRLSVVQLRAELHRYDGSVLLSVVVSVYLERAERELSIFY